MCWRWGAVYSKYFHPHPVYLPWRWTNARNAIFEIFAYYALDNLLLGFSFCFLLYLKVLTNKVANWSVCCSVAKIYAPHYFQSPIFVQNQVHLNLAPSVCYLWFFVPKFEDIIEFEGNWIFVQKWYFLNSMRPKRGNKVLGWKCNAFSSFAKVLIIKREVHNSKRTRKKCKILHLLPRFLMYFCIQGWMNGLGT